MSIFTLTVDGKELATTIHATEADALDNLIVNYADGEDQTRETIIDYLTDSPGGYVVYLEEHEVPEVKLRRVVYNPPTYDEEEEVWSPSSLTCPDCASDYVVQVDKAVRWNEYDEDTTIPSLIVWSTSGDADFETSHYHCASCITDLDRPIGTELPREDPKFITEDYT